jgi:hypothetical protein
MSLAYFKIMLLALNWNLFFKRHSDHREFLCANCGKQFKRKDKLKEHMKRMHSAERELRLAMKPHRTPTAKKFMPKVQVKLSCTASLFIFLVVVWGNDEILFLCWMASNVSTVVVVHCFLNKTFLNRPVEKDFLNREDFLQGQCKNWVSFFGSTFAFWLQAVIW